MWGLLILAPLQILVGDEVGIGVLDYQPIKTAAIEGIWNTQKGAPLLLFALPDQKAEKNYLEVGIPKLAALINTHHLEGVLTGLKSVVPADRPNVAVVFWSFRIMVGLGLLILLLAFIGSILRYKNRLYDTSWFLKSCLIASPMGFICIITGWFTAEFGRQPWVVYHYLRTHDAQSPVLLHNLFISLLSIILVYGVIFGYFYFRYFFHIIKYGPTEDTKQTDQAFFYMSPTIGKKETQQTPKNT